jgi:hypothetical protein
MTGLNTIDSSSDLRRLIAEYIARCELILDIAFLGSAESRRGFPIWIKERFQESEYPTLLLHDDPVYVVGRFFGMLPLNIPPNIMERATKLGKERGW